MQRPSPVISPASKHYISKQKRLEGNLVVVPTMREKWNYYKKIRTITTSCGTTQKAIQQNNQVDSLDSRIFTHTLSGLLCWRFARQLRGNLGGRSMLDTESETYCVCLKNCMICHGPSSLVAERGGGRVRVCELWGLPQSKLQKMHLVQSGTVCRGKPHFTLMMKRERLFILNILEKKNKLFININYNNLHNCRNSTIQSVRTSFSEQNVRMPFFFL